MKGSAHLEALRQRSIRTLSRVWRINNACALLLIAVYAVGADWPVTLHKSPWIGLAVLLGILLLLRISPGLMAGPLETMQGLSFREDPRVTQLQIHRERLQQWSSSFMALLATMAGLQHLVRLLRYEALDTTARLVRISVVVGVAGLVILLLPYLRRRNRSAAQVLQEEIDAIRAVESERLLENRL